MHHAPRTTIRCWTTSLFVITVVAVVGATGRGYAVEARSWAGAVVAAVTVTGQGLAMRLARGAARAASPSASLVALAGGAR